MKEDYENIAVGFEECFQQKNTLINNPVLEIEGIIYKLQFLCVVTIRQVAS